MSSSSILVLLALFGPFPAFSHHSPAGRFDPQSIIEVEGVVTAVHWRSPHVELTLEAVDDAGGRATWQLESAAPATLARSGLSAATIEAGDRVRVAGWPPVTDKKELFLQNMLLPTSRELLLRVSANVDDYPLTASARSGSGRLSQELLGLDATQQSFARLQGLSLFRDL